MKISKSFILSLCLMMVNPFLSVLQSFTILDKKRSKYCVYILSLFVFFLTIKTPPYQDLYRRYLVTYLAYNNDTSLWDALSGHIDFLFYANAWLFYKLELPFYLIPAIYSSLATYFILISASEIWEKTEEKFSTIKLLIVFLGIFSFVDVVMIASTLRFGFAIALILRGGVLFYRERNIKSVLFITLACLCHASMVLVALCIILSIFYKISKKQCIFLSLIFFFSSKYIIPIVLANFSFGGLSGYFQAGYLNTDFANITNDSNTLLLQSYKYLLLLSFLFVYFRYDGVIREYDNFVRILIVLSCLMAVSVTAMNRYLIGVTVQFVMFGALAINTTKWLNHIYTMILIILLTFNILFINIYLERRQIIMANMWTVLYTPPVFLMTYTMSDFNKYLGDIDADGNWVKDRLGKK